MDPSAARVAAKFAARKTFYDYVNEWMLDIYAAVKHNVGATDWGISKPVAKPRFHFRLLAQNLEDNYEISRHVQYLDDVYAEITLTAEGQELVISCKVVDGSKIMKTDLKKLYINFPTNHLAEYIVEFASDTFQEAF